MTEKASREHVVVAFGRGQHVPMVQKKKKKMLSLLSLHMRSEKKKLEDKKKSRFL